MWKVKMWAVTGCDGLPITGYISADEPDVPNKAQVVIRPADDDEKRNYMLERAAVLLESAAFDTDEQWEEGQQIVDYVEGR